MPANGDAPTTQTSSSLAPRKLLAHLQQSQRLRAQLRAQRAPPQVDGRTRVHLDLFTLHWAVGAHQIDDRARAIGLELDDEVLGRCPVGNAPTR